MPDDSTVAQKDDEQIPRASAPRHASQPPRETPGVNGSGASHASTVPGLPLLPPRLKNDFYQRLAESYRVRYGSDFSRMFHQYHFERLMAAAAPTVEKTVLDAGCGGGAVLHCLSGAFGSVVGLDLSPEMLGIIDRGTDSNCALVLGQMERIPLPDESVDCIICRGALSHVDAVPPILQEFQRVLKHGGVVVISEPSLDSVLLRLPRAVITSRSKVFKKGHKAYGSNDLLPLLRRAGLTVARKEYFGYLSFPICDMADVLPILPRLPFKTGITAMLIAIDRVLSLIPVVNRQAWHLILTAHKP